MPKPQLTRSQQDDALSFAEMLIEEAILIARQYPTGAASAVKADGTPVTEVDQQIERMVRDYVGIHRPQEVVLGEETYEGGGPAASQVWVVDPIDGTELFATGTAGYVSSIALVVEGDPEIAFVGDPVTGQTWVARAGGGAWTDGRRMQVSQAFELPGARALLPRSAQYGWPDVCSLANSQGLVVLETGSVVRSGMDVADGTNDGLIFGRSGPWDMAAAALMVPEAGGRYTDLAGHPSPRLDMLLNGAVVSNGRIHDELLGLVANQMVG